MRIRQWVLLGLFWIWSGTVLLGQPVPTVAPIDSSGELLTVSEIDGLTHLAIPAGQDFRGTLEKLDSWLPWQPVMFDARTLVWLDFEQFPPALKGFGQNGKQTWYGVDMYALQVVCLLDEGEAEPLGLNWAARWDWPADAAMAQRYQELICAQFGLREFTEKSYRQLLANGHGWLMPRMLTIAVWVANQADRAKYLANMAAELAAWEETERQQRSMALQPMQAENTMASGLKVGGQMQMLLVNGCGITNDAAPFAAVIHAQTNGNVTVTWESCSSHLYGVYSREDLVAGHWQAQLWMVGLDGTSSWTDTNAATQAHCFYKVRRLTLDGADDDGDGLSNVDEFNTYGTDPGNPDTDGDGMPDGWEVQYGFNPLNPSDGSLDFDDDGVSNSAEYVQGRDPTKGAVPDLNNDVNLVVFTRME